MPFSISEPPSYVLDQVFGYQSVNSLFDNDASIRDSINTEHDFATGVHNTPKVARVEGLITYSAGYSVTRHTNISGVSSSATGIITVSFSVTFTDQDFAPDITPQNSGGASPIIAGWGYTGASKTSVIVYLEDDTGTAADSTFSIAVRGMIE